MTDIPLERRLLDEQGLDIVERETWAAAYEYTSARDVDMPARGFVLHISVTIDHGELVGTEHADMRTIERIGQQRFGLGFPYNAAAFDTGRLYEGQPLTRRGAHTVNTYALPQYPRSMNYAWRALVLPQMERDDVTDVQIDAAARWAAAQIRAGLARSDATWIGHRDVTAKACPGATGYARLPDLNHLTRHYRDNGLGRPQETNDLGTLESVTPAGQAQLTMIVADAVTQAVGVFNGKDGPAAQAMRNRTSEGVNATARTGGSDLRVAVHELASRAVAELGLDSMTAEAIAAAIPPELADEVVALLTAPTS